MVKAIRVYQHGGPEVLKLEDIEIGDPKEGEIRVKHIAIGVNFVDVYMRKDLFNSSPPLPFTPGLEGAGVVTVVGAGVTSCKVGDIVAYGVLDVGSYSEERLVRAYHAVPVPSTIDPVVAAAVIFKGLTAEVLVRHSFKVGGEHTILVHAAAGGVGSFICQWSSSLGAMVIGTVSTKEKAAQAKEDGCHHVILYKEENFLERVMEITSGKGVDAVYDSVGKETFEGSVTCLKPGGTLLHFGSVSGRPDPKHFDQISSKSLIYKTPGFTEYLADRNKLLAAAGDLFSNVEKGVLKVRINHKYPLSQAIQAHLDLESRKTTGSIVLVPDNE